MKYNNYTCNYTLRTLGFCCLMAMIMKGDRIWFSFLSSRMYSRL